MSPEKQLFIITVLSKIKKGFQLKQGKTYTLYSLVLRYQFTL